MSTAATLPTDTRRHGRNGLVWLVTDYRATGDAAYPHELRVDVIDGTLGFVFPRMFDRQTWRVPELSLTDPAYMRPYVAPSVDGGDDIGYHLSLARSSAIAHAGEARHLAELALGERVTPAGRAELEYQVGCNERIAAGWQAEVERIERDLRLEALGLPVYRPDAT